MVFIDKPSTHATPKIWVSQNLLSSTVRNLIRIHLQKSWSFPICVWSLKKLMVPLWFSYERICSPISMECAQNASWLCDPFRDDGFFFMDDDRCGLMVCVSEPKIKNKKIESLLICRNVLLDVCRPKKIGAGSLDLHGECVWAAIPSHRVVRGVLLNPSQS